jgi:hypothetical protein
VKEESYFECARALLAFAAWPRTTAGAFYAKIFMSAIELWAPTNCFKAGWAL